MSGTQLNAWRLAEGLTLEELGRRIEATTVTASRYCAGKRLPSPPAMVRIYVITGGRVQPNHFYDLPRLVPLRQALQGADGEGQGLAHAPGQEGAPGQEAPQNGGVAAAVGGGVAGHGGRLARKGEPAA